MLLMKFRTDLTDPRLRQSHEYFNEKILKIILYTCILNICKGYTSLLLCCYQAVLLVLRS